MNDDPFFVVTTDRLPKCAALFREMHLRHLVVLDPTTGTLEGIITRQDLFTWLDL